MFRRAGSATRLANSTVYTPVNTSAPASSGTAYTAVATVVQVMGEAKAFEYLERLHANVNQYTKSGVAPAKAVARGPELLTLKTLGRCGPVDASASYPHSDGVKGRRIQMDARDLFLDQHGAVHSAAVGGNKMSAAERALGGLSDEQMRVRPREDLNSLAWLMWHIARAEDIFVNSVLAGRSQVFDDAWMRRLGITRRDFGIGMTSPEVSELTRQIDLGALREYRDAVGLRTREAVGGFDWSGAIPAEAMERAAAEGAFGSRTEPLVKAFTGRPRTAVLSGIALFHPSGHLGEAVTVRSAGGFGTGV